MFQNELSSKLKPWTNGFIDHSIIQMYNFQQILVLINDKKIIEIMKKI